ncbi:MAG: glycosyltransferase family 1 protein [Candidatus Spechtbacterales bacterium]
MRIAIDVRPLEGGRYGGVAEYINQLLPALFARAPQHEFHLITNGRRIRNDYRNLVAPNATLHQFSYPNKFFMWGMRYAQRPRLDQLVGGADVLFSPHIFPVALSSACRQVLTFHDLSFEYFPETFSWRKRFWHKAIAPGAQARGADGLIAVSESTKQDLVRSYGIAPDTISVVYSGLNAGTLSEQTHGFNAVKRRYRLPEHYILSLSTVEPRKNLSMLIRAFELLAQGETQVHLVIAGAFGWSYDDVVHAQKRSPVRERIHIVGAVREEDKAHLYRHARLFVYPSQYEGFGFPPLEAMYCGVPTLVSAVSSLPEVTAGAAILIDPYRPDELARVMAETLYDERLRARLRVAGMARARTFSWDRAAAQTLDVLERTGRNDL